MNKTTSEDRLPPGQHLVSPGKWPTIGEKLPQPSQRPWELTITGLVDSEQTFSLSRLQEFSQTELVTDIHCVTRWSKYDVAFKGVLLADLLAIAGVKSDANFVSFVARSEREHSTSLPLSEAVDLGTMIVTQAEGQPLPEDKGGPIRSIVPRRYFYKSVKWVERIELLEFDRLGFWETDSGYHNQADPWLEQRFISQSVDKKQAKILIDSLDFRDQDLLSIDVRNHDLAGLQADRALLRNADFSNCRLANARFVAANLSNAKFIGADLSNADFTGADLEGANLAGANLAGANLTDCSLFGSTFCDQSDDPTQTISNGATLSPETTLETASYEVLTPIQFEYVQRQLQKFR